jgi:hypothetical protein
MVTRDQQKWLDHLSNTEVIKIVSYDKEAPLIFEKVKKLVTEALGNNFKVLHRGASYLKISGQDEIDIYVPVLPSCFDEVVARMTEVFSEPRSLYPLVRARFRLDGFGKHIDVFVINEEDKGWVDSEKFTNYSLENPVVLEEYRQLKEEGNGLSVREYYTRKIEFINNVLSN